jgi:chromosomal replication initiation ATPase DnaA
VQTFASFGVEPASIVEIGYPDINARVEIARRAAEYHCVALSDQTLRYLAEQLTGTPRASERHRQDFRRGVDLGCRRY